MSEALSLLIALQHITTYSIHLLAPAQLFITVAADGFANSDFSPWHVSSHPYGGCQGMWSTFYDSVVGRPLQLFVQLLSFACSSSFFSSSASSSLSLETCCHSFYSFLGAAFTHVVSANPSAPVLFNRAPSYSCLSILQHHPHLSTSTKTLLASLN